MTYDYAKEMWLALQEDSSGPNDPDLLAPTVLEELQRTNSHLMEQLRDVQMMFQLEDRGWELLLGGLANSKQPGLDLDQQKEVAEKIQSYIVGNPIIKRGTELRASYIWSKGVDIPGVSTDASKRGRKSDVERFCRDELTKRYLLGAESHGEKERAAVSSGEYLLVGDDTKRRLLYPVPVDEITGILVNPEYSGEVWAYQRTWNTLNAEGQTEVRRLWIYTDRYTGIRKTSIGVGSSKIDVAKDRTMFDQTFNSQVGWPLGIPDGLAAIVWARIYSELMNHGKVMTEALARFALKVTVNSQKGADKIGIKMAAPGSRGAGETAVLGAGNSLEYMANAGKSYDFNGIRAVAAMVATSLEVSIVHLLSDPGAAGSSYGSASNLDLPTKRAMVARQNIWAGYLERIIKWATNQDITVTFPSLDDPDPYRETQIKAIAWGTGLVHEDEARDAVLESANIHKLHDSPPEGVLLPNNEASWQRADIDPKDNPAKQGSSPDQGKSNGSGGTPGDVKNDLRSDSVAEMIARVRNQDFITDLRELVERLERAMGSR